MKKNRVSILIIVAIFVSTCVVGLSLARLPEWQSTVFADDPGYPVTPVDEFGYPIYGTSYPDPGYPAPTDDIGYPVEWYGYPDPGYPIEPLLGQKPAETATNPNEMEPVRPQYVNGRNLWQEIMFQFSKLLEKIK